MTIKTEDVVRALRLLARGQRFNAVPVVIDAADTIERLREENARVTEALAICQEHNRKMLRARFEAARAPRKRRAALTHLSDRIQPRLPRFDGAGTFLPEFQELAGAVILRIGTIPDLDLEGGGLVIEYRPPGGVRLGC